MANQKNRALQAKLPKLSKQKTETRIEVRAIYTVHDYYQRKFYADKRAQTARFLAHI